MPDRRPWPLVALLALAAVPTVFAAAGAPVEVETIKVGLDEKYKIGTWTPIWVQARAGVEAFEGTMEVVSDDESGTPTAFAQAVRIGAGESSRLTAYTRPGSNSGEFAVRFVDREGKRVASTSVSSLRPNNPPTTIFSDDIVLLALGKPQGVELVPGIPGLNGGRAASGTPTAGSASVVEVVRPGGLDGALLPGRAYGYDAFDAVVIDTNDKEIMAALAVQGEALRQWVAGGGHLVVAVGSNGQVVRDSPLGPMLPADVAGTVEIADLRTIEAFARATSQIAGQSLRVAKLDVGNRPSTKTLCSTTSAPIVVRGAYGFGRVTLVGLDVDSSPFDKWPDRAQFWVTALDLHPASSANATNQVRNRLTQFGVNDLSSQLRVGLEQFPGVKLIPFGWVAVFIFLYILLIGPGDYFFLKKVVKRMELTWVTFPLIVVVVSLAAYWAAYKVKGTELRVNQVDVLDVDVAGKVARGASFFNVFSPQNRDYDVALTPKPLDGGPAMPAGTEVRLSWFGAPEAGLRGMNGGGRSAGFASAGYRYGPVGRAERVDGVRIPIWSTKAFSARWTAPADGPPPIESDLSPNGVDRLNGTITNRLAVPLRKAVLAYGNRVYYGLDDLQPNESKRIELIPDRTLSGYLNDIRKSFLASDTYRDDVVTIDRANLMRSILFRDSDASGANPLPSRPLHDLDLTGQLLLDRPILVAEVDPGTAVAEVDLGGTFRLDRTTLLRVILPLSK